MRTPLFAFALAILTSLAPLAASATGLDRPDAGATPEPFPSNHASPGAFPYVIVTTRELAPELLRLANAHARDGLRAGIWTIESIRSAYPGGRDDAERIRLFLQDARRERGARWLLLGGNATLIPVRLATLRPGFAPPYDVVALPTDQYYACLDGSWNADGDDAWGEIATDDVDLTPDLIVGRAPIATRQETRRFVERTLEALETARHAGPSQVLLAAEQLGTILDLGASAEQARPLLESVPGTHVARLYENAAAWPGSAPESRLALIDSLNRGYDLAVLWGAGLPREFSAGQDFGTVDRFTIDDASGLQNRHATIVYFVSALVCSLGATPCVGEAIFNAPRGGAVAVVGPTAIAFVSWPHRFALELFTETYRNGVTTIGEALTRTIAANVSPFDLARLVTQGTILLGDPALPMNPPAPLEPAAGIIASPAEALANSAGLTPLALAAAPVMTERPAARPSPSASSATRPSAGASRGAALSVRLLSRDPAEARLELAVPAAFAGARLDVVVFDPEGRRVRILDRDTVRAGSRIIAWDLRDDAGGPVRSGIYFVDVRLAGHSLARRVTVVR